MSKDRRTYYEFAHIALRSLFLGKPGDVMAALASTGSMLLVDLWQAVAEHNHETFPADGLECEVRRETDGTSIGLVTLPEPRDMTECYYVALVFALGETPRYLTCELTVHPGEEQAREKRAVLCEWGGGAHMNTGQIFSPEREDFYRRVVERLAASRGLAE